MQQRGRALALAAGLLLGLGAVVTSAGPALAAPGITVDPSGPLQASATVTVTATGFRPRTTVVVAECRPDGSGGVPGPTACADPITGSSVVVLADAEGAIRATLRVTVGDIRSGVSCTGDGCVIAAVSTVVSTTQALAPLSLTGAATTLPPAAGASAAPTSSPSPSGTGSPSPTPSASTGSPTAEASAATTAPTPTPTPLATTPAATPNSALPPTSLPRTGPQDAGRSLLLGLVALQVGLLAAVRMRRRPATDEPTRGRHLR